MAYDRSNLFCVSKTTAKVSRWMYLTTDPLVTVLGASYFFDAAARRVKAGDPIDVIIYSTRTSGSSSGEFSGFSSFNECEFSSVSSSGGTAVPVSGLSGLLGLRYVTDTRLSSGTAGAITLALPDAGALLYHPSTDSTSRVVTIDTNAHVAFGDTATIPFWVDIGAGTLVFTPAVGVTLVLSGASASTATAAAGYGGVLMHVTGDLWTISGGSLS